MVKNNLASGSTPSIPGKNDKFKEKLLRRRRTYPAHFRWALESGRIDDALRRVVAYRALHAGVERTMKRPTGVTAMGEYSYDVIRLEKPRLSGKTRVDLSAIARELVGKRKEHLKKYSRHVATKLLDPLLAPKRAARRKSYAEHTEMIRTRKRDREWSVYWAEKGMPGVVMGKHELKSLKEISGSDSVGARELKLPSSHGVGSGSRPGFRGAFFVPNIVKRPQATGATRTLYKEK